ncbi:hypothetical protein [Devosia sp. 2618]|uniref:MFS transporter n=1 Tax=Devosia sp. 2618 TaxID=3156454 RepID=UPI00339B2E86
MTVNRRPGALILAAIFLCAFNLRSSITGFSALSDIVLAAVQLNGAWSAAIGGVGIFLLGAASLFGGYLLTYVELQKAVAGLLVGLCAAILLRTTGQSFALLTMTLLLFLQIGLLGAILPLAIRQFGDKAPPQAAGAMTFGVIAGAASGPVSTIFVFDHTASWQVALCSSLLPAVVALVIWLLLKFPSEVAVSGHHKLPVASRSGWFLTFYFGSQSALAFIVFIWIVPILRVRGLQAGEAAMLASGSIASQAIGVMLPLVFQALRTRAGVVAAVLAFTTLCTFLTLIFGPWALIWPAAIGLGVGQGGTLCLSYVMLNDRAGSGAGLSSMMHGFGLLLAGIGPLLVGFAMGGELALRGVGGVVVGFGVSAVVFALLCSPRRTQTN